MKIQVLDHGYVEFVEAWGTGKSGRDDTIGYPFDHEVGIIEAARQSTQGGFRGWEPAACDCGAGEAQKLHHDFCAYAKNPGDRRLLSYLYSHKHMTPFEFSGMVLEIQAPIFVFREWHRHRTQSYNEASARYAPLPDLNYMPSIERLTMLNETNKQAGSWNGGKLGQADAEFFQLSLLHQYLEAQQAYEDALRSNVPKELARLVLPVGRYSKMRASANLRNWLAFMTLRCDPAAQWEIRQYANAVANIVAEKFPHTFKLWGEEVYGAVP